MNKKTQQIVGVVAILGLGYWAYTKYGKKKSFANLTSKRTQYIAGGYDSNHQNPDGTRGATWISYGGTGAYGYWQPGRVAQGTIVNP